MSKFTTLDPIGAILQEADLITSSQLEIALNDQAYYEGMRLGEILTLRSWIKQDTANFFVQDWSKLINRKIERPIGFYLNKAGLISKTDIEIILREQRVNPLLFGEIAIEKGLLKPSTVNFFVQNLCSRQLAQSDKNMKTREKRDRKITKEDMTYWAKRSLVNLAYS